MDPATVTLEDGLRLLSLPREVGRHPDDDEPIYAQNGRYGAYVSWNKETRSLDSEDAIFAIDLDGALALLASPKQRGRRQAAGPLRELGDDPVTGRPVVVRTGRFGPYVTDGEVNATLRLGDTPETVSLDRACELLAERRNAEPSTRARRARKATTKKATTKKAAKKSTKKAAKKSTTSTSKAIGADKRATVARGAAANAALASMAQGAESL
jgi:DNA topoisomerase-1